MRKRHADHWDEYSPDYGDELPSTHDHSRFARANSPDEVFGEIGLVLVIVLGIVVGINTVLVALHIG